MESVFIVESFLFRFMKEYQFKNISSVSGLQYYSEGISGHNVAGGCL